MLGLYSLVDISFFDKEYILISKRYQLHPASATTQHPNDITDAHSQKKKKNNREEKSRYGDKFLVEAVQITPPKQHQKSSFSNIDASRKEIVHKRHHPPIIDHRY
jgi:hypothetical protein